MARKTEGIDWVISAANDLENANYHSLTHVPEDLYLKLTALVPPKLHTELGKIIYDCLHNV